MTILELLKTKNAEQAAYIMFQTDIKNNCIHCSHFCEDDNHEWYCNSPWHEQFCKQKWDSFISCELDKG